MGLLPCLHSRPSAAAAAAPADDEFAAAAADDDEHGDDSCRHCWAPGDAAGAVGPAQQCSCAGAVDILAHGSYSELHMNSRLIAELGPQQLPGPATRSRGCASPACP